MWKLVIAIGALNTILALTTISNPLEKSENELIFNRQKRFLIFPNGGTAKFVGGYLGPIDTPKFINCNAIRNVQYQYDLPANVKSLFNKFSNRGRSIGSDENERKLVGDSTRQIAYELVEEIMQRDGKNGRECLMRTICEVAETPLKHNGLMGEVLQMFFSPGQHELIHQDYKDAHKAGLNRIDCLNMYPNCPIGNGLLDNISLIEEFKFMDLFWQI
ncbi:unnamed protein product [Diamesa serratosioi]